MKAGNSKLQQYSHEQIASVIKRLSYREREIIKLRCGMGDGFIYTLDEVGHIFKVTRERIRQVEAKAVRRIQNYLEGETTEG